MLDRGLCRCQQGNGHSVGTAADDIEANSVAKLHAERVSAVLAADADVHLGAHRSGEGDGEAHEATHPALVDADEGILGVDLPTHAPVKFTITAGRKLQRKTDDGPSRRRSA